MNTQKLTYAGMLSALMVTMTVVAMMTGIGYTFYLDLCIPIMVGLIYLKCDFKYTVISCLISVSIILFGVGDLPTGIWMIQSIMIGLICSTLISKNTTVMDDLLGCSIGGAFIVVFIDIYCENILGMSIMKELWHTLDRFSLNQTMKDIFFYISMASLPVGTSIVTYIGTLFLGSRLHLLKGRTLQKFNIIKNIRVYGSYMCCSPKTTNMGIVYLVFIQLFQGIQLPLYIKTVVYSAEYIVLYFILRDAYSFMTKYIYAKTKSIGATKGIGIGTLILLIKQFRITTILLTATIYILDKRYHLRKQHIKVLNKSIYF
ncbi:MAG: hypothetical protein AB9856_06125 [Cellulosilyticaceae bacterium]